MPRKLQILKFPRELLSLKTLDSHWCYPSGVLSWMEMDNRIIPDPRLPVLGHWVTWVTWGFVPQTKNSSCSQLWEGRDREWSCPWYPSLRMHSEWEWGHPSEGEFWGVTPPKCHPWEPQGHRNPMPSSSGSGIQVVPRFQGCSKECLCSGRVSKGMRNRLVVFPLEKIPFTPLPLVQIFLIYLPCWGFTNSTSINIPQNSNFFGGSVQPLTTRQFWFQTHSYFPAL